MPVTAGRSESVYLQARDVGGMPRPLRYSLPGGPAWAGIDAASGQITLRPDDDVAGIFPITVRVAVAGNDKEFDEKTLKVIVREAPPPTGDYDVQLPSGKLVSTGVIPTRSKLKRTSRS